VSLFIPYATFSLLHSVQVIVSLRKNVSPPWKAIATDELFITTPVYFVQRFPHRDIDLAEFMVNLHRQQAITLRNTHWDLPRSSTKFGIRRIMIALEALDTLRRFRHIIDHLNSTSTDLLLSLLSFTHVAFQCPDKPPLVHGKALHDECFAED